LNLPINQKQLTLSLAPMEGVADANLRNLISSVGGYDYCVTEFIRISSTVFPDHKFITQCPELLENCATPTKTPVHVQLLGSDPHLMALNAFKAQNLGAKVIDVNFGCPAKTVNNSNGGACLLKDPNILHDVCKSIRDTLPNHVRLSAKMRLGFHDKSLCLENAAALKSAGVDWITVHARTKDEGYKPPAHWEYIAQIKQHTKLPIVANGDIWSVDDYIRCRDITGCSSFMLGRGAVRVPDLALQIKAYDEQKSYVNKDWQQMLVLINQYCDLLQTESRVKYQTGRLKQWFNFLKHAYRPADDLFDQLKRLNDLHQMRALINSTS
jgi:tRNA-dihydrouridine synthase C